MGYPERACRSGSGIEIFEHIYSFLYGIPEERLPERVAD